MQGSAALLLTGGCAVGKSEFAARFVGNSNAVLELHSPKNQTRVVRYIEKVPSIFVIDTPGFTGRNSEDNQTTESIRHAILRFTGVIALALVTNGQSARFVKNDEQVLQAMNVIFPKGDWVSNFFVIFTHCSAQSRTAPIPDHQWAYLQQVSKTIARLRPNEQSTQLQIRHFVVDSLAKESCRTTQAEIGEIVKLMEQSQRLEVTDQITNGGLFTTVCETKTTTVEERTQGDIKIQITQREKREKRTFFDGDVLYTAWEPDGDRVKWISRLV